MLNNGNYHGIEDFNGCSYYMYMYVLNIMYEIILNNLKRTFDTIILFCDTLFREEKIMK